MDIQTVCRVLQPIWDLERESGDNAWFQQELAKQIQATGKTANDLTVGELLALCKKADAALGEAEA